MTITLTGEPKSTNHIYKSTCRGGYASVYLSPKGKELKDDYYWQVKDQYHGELLTEPLVIDITVYHGTHRKNDWDNFHKLSMDALTGTVWEDDSQIIDAHVHKRYDKENPRIVITIEKL